MQKDSMHFSNPVHMMHNQAAPQESPSKSFHCSHCPLNFKSKVFFFEHLNNVHGFSVDAALRDAALTGTDTANADNNDDNDSSRSTFECQHCDFKACSWDVFKKHEMYHKKSEDQNVKGNLIISENVISANPHKTVAGANETSSSVMSTSKTKCTLNLSRDLKTYKKPLQTITKYFKTSPGSDGKPPVESTDNPMLLDSTRGTLILQESSSGSSPNSSGVLKVTAKSMIDLSRMTDQYLLNDNLLIADLTPPMPKGQIREPIPNKAGKRTCKESLKSSPEKKIKMDKKEAKESKQETSSSTEFSFEVSDDDEKEKRVNLVNGDMESPKVYFCKHCDYSDVGIQSVSTHYQSDHPYVRYTSDYIQDSSDQSATFRCLECPVEFLSVADLKKHYTQNHPEAPNVFSMQLRELHLVFKCFVCPFTINTLKALRGHYKEKHPKHEVNNSLMYCRYLATRCQEGSSQLNTCEKTSSSERISTESGPVPCEEVKNAPSSQHATSKAAGLALFQCTNCNFSHKSVVVMHVHYQKSHPEEAVTIDKIKQSALVTSQTTPQKTSGFPNSVTIIDKSTPQKKISYSQIQETKGKAKMQQQKISFSKHTPETSETHSESPKTKKVESAEEGTPSKRDKKMTIEMDSLSPTSPNTVFYCQFCSYSSTKIKSVLGHHNAKHSMHTQIGIEEILKYSAEFQKKKLQREAEASASTSSSTLVTKFNAYARAEDLFYCQKCNYGNPSVKGVITHQSKMHPSFKYSSESVIKYTAIICDEIKKSKSQAKESSISTDLPLPLLSNGDEHLFFCHFCNYRQSTVSQLVHHYYKTHRGFVAKAKQIRLHTSMVLEQTQKLHQKATANQEVNQASVGKNRNKKKKSVEPGTSSSVSASSSKEASQTQKTLQCPRCPYITQHVYLLRRHIWKIHRSRCSVSDVLNVCFKQGNLQSGYHCELCVFTDKKASTVYKHYQEKHPGRRLSIEFVTTRLYVGPETSSPKKKKPQIKHTDGISDCDGTNGSLSSLRSGQNETKLYPCRACSFKGRSVSSITHHYRAVHPWSVKEDGSVLDVINRKKQSANKQVEEHSKIPGSFDTYQVPLEFDNSPDSPHEATGSFTWLKCPCCPARFHTHHGLKTHCGMKHQQYVTETLEELQEQEVQVQTRVHVFKCPHCTYVNTNYQGVLTHCQMRHPTLASKADSLHVDEEHLRFWDGCLKRNGPDGILRFSGHMCKTCPQIHATLEKLNKHCEEDHNRTVPNTVSSASRPAPELPAVSATQNTQGSVSQGSSVNTKPYGRVRCHHCAYSCSTKIALSRHLRAYHKNAPVLPAQDCVYKCVICSKSFFEKKRLGCHYTKIHGKDAFFKYYAPVYQNVPKKPAPTSPDHPSSQEAENTSEACQSGTVTEKNIIVFKCPSCPYVNASSHGTLTHCQMQHPALLARTDELQKDEILLTNMVACTLGKGYNERGYMCKICPQIHASLKKLKIHLERDHGKEALRKHNANVYHQKCKRPQLPSSVQNKYNCDLCAYSGMKRRYLWSHYRKYHRFDALTTYKRLAKYNKPGKKVSNLPEAEPDSEESAQIKCQKCPNLFFDSFELLIGHYSSFHRSDWKLDFTVLYPVSKSSTGVYKCCHCKKQLNGIRKLCLHMDHHRARNENRGNAAKKMAERTKAPDVVMITPEAKSTELRGQDEMSTLEAVEELAQRNVTLLASPLSTPSKPADLEQPEPESSEGKHTCKQCLRTFMSLKGLRCHERSHAAVAAIKRLDNLPTSALKQIMDKYILFKSGTLRPFQCSICLYRTTVMALWRSHFMKNHQDVIVDPAETDNQDEENTQMAEKEPPNSSEKLNNLPEHDEEPESSEESLYLEPPDVQRQLNHYSLMAEAGTSSKANVKKNKVPENSLLHCEFCNFTSGHLSSIRRHLLNRHGKKMFRCKDCNFFTGLRKTLEMHIETGHSTFQSEPTHQKDFRCPFCLYQTKNKNNMIDHIILHREERVVPIEVRRPKLSRYLQGIVFRCHKCTFTSASAENLRLHMMRHDDIKPYKCRLCYFDCTQLCDLEAHLCDKHQVMRNHALVGQVSLDQQEARLGRMPEEEEEPASNLEHHNNESEDIETEEFVEVPHETHARNPAVNDKRENIKLQIEGLYQQQKQGSRKENEESVIRSSAFNLQYKNNANPNTAVQEKHGQDPQERAQNEMLLTDTAIRREANAAEGNNTGDCNNPEKEKQMNENQPQPRGNVDSRLILMQQREEAAEGSSTKYVRIAEKAQAHKLQIKALQGRTLNNVAKVEDGILRRILRLGEDGSILRTHRKAVHDRTVKIEQSIETKVADNVLNMIVLRDEEGSITLAQHPKNHPEDRTEVTPDVATKNLMLANIKRFTAERHLLTLTPNCAQLKMSHNKQADRESLSFSVSNCKEVQVHNQISCEELTDSYGAMPVLEKEFRKEEPLGCCKEEGEDDHFGQKQDRGDKVIIENTESRCKDQEHVEGGRMKDADNPHVPKGTLTAVDEAAEVRRSTITEKKLFTCEFCGRNLMSSCELERHIVRHGM